MIQLVPCLARRSLPAPAASLAFARAMPPTRTRPIRALSQGAS